MRKLRLPGAVMGLFALGLEATGVASGAYVYGDFPLKILGVPLCIPVMWVLVMAMAYVISKEHGPLAGVLSAYSLDLALEPIAYYTGIWTWLEPYTLQVYWGSTVANALVWLGMCCIGIKLWELNDAFSANKHSFSLGHVKDHFHMGCQCRECLELAVEFREPDI